MTSPPTPIECDCPRCGARVKDWWRPSITVGIDQFDEEYLDEASSATCSECGARIRLGTIFGDGRGTFSVHDPSPEPGA